MFTADEMLHHWRGHRALTRRTIERFPDEHLFTFTPGAPLRTFGEMMLETVRMVAPSLHGVESGKWDFTQIDTSDVHEKAVLLHLWDEADALIEARWPHLTRDALRGVVPPLPHLTALPYLVENEIHHRGQGFVYLRLLGIEPPAFYER
ncbi:DNA damage-inducible protein DinB [Deinococcus malanensis]|uniref:DNA damage-inducible protein DinB n=1 Tax=Deinococcus malanensis TaxID=1706855 RepID=A0ABQ2F5P5_9DEIO|nr:DNA damage-inducible protein DinB [Deinococcus malanensis]